MKRPNMLIMVLCVPLACAALAGTARAGELNQSTFFRFSKPVEVPGRVLPAGSYQFKLMSFAGNLNIVEIYKQNQAQPLAMLLTIPAFRWQLTDKPAINFKQRQAGSPEAIHDWFYPGNAYGHAFVYPTLPVVETAQARGSKVPSDSTGLAADVAGAVVSGTRNALHFLAKTA